MSNSIRTPKWGTTEHHRRIARAVDDEDWQKFRVSLKGTPTSYKIAQLLHYWSTNGKPTDQNNAVYIRVDNYIKALSRGGQLHKYESLESIINTNWTPKIKR